MKQICFREEDTTFKCELCEKSFTTKGNLKTHVEKVHEGKKPIKCGFCEETFEQKVTLNKHIVSVHEEKKVFNCNLCQKTFATKGSLAKHNVHHVKTDFVSWDKSNN